MLKVFKYPVSISDYFEIQMPKDAKILKIDCQLDDPCLWALVDPSQKSETRKFRFAGTGHTIVERKDSLKFIDTIQMAGGSLIFHIFELTSNNAN